MWAYDKTMKTTHNNTRQHKPSTHSAHSPSGQEHKGLATLYDAGPCLGSTVGAHHHGVVTLIRLQGQLLLGLQVLLSQFVTLEQHIQGTKHAAD